MDNEFKELFNKTVALKSRLRNYLETLKEEAFKERKVYTHPFIEEIKKYLDNTDGEVWDVLPHSVNIMDKYNEVHEINFYKVELKNSLIYVTGYCDGNFNEHMYITEDEEQLWAVLNLVFDILSIEDKQKRTFLAGEEVLYHCYEEDDNEKDEWMQVVDDTNVSSPDEMVNLKNAEGKVMQRAAKYIYKKIQYHRCPYCKKDDKLCTNHLEAEDSWYCTDCGHYIYPWTYQNDSFQ